MLPPVNSNNASWEPWTVLSTSPRKKPSPRFHHPTPMTVPTCRSSRPLKTLHVILNNASSWPWNTPYQRRPWSRSRRSRIWCPLIPLLASRITLMTLRRCLALSLHGCRLLRIHLLEP
ncbi:hypothetical protein BC829DRAFT_391188 [Chytridium lagenaria]|nr:hypothetical protein BC829DRAFT_391188 [Chytridium lagenaria]